VEWERGEAEWSGVSDQAVVDDESCLAEWRV
jgi:hypothetical protein